MSTTALVPAESIVHLVARHLGYDAKLYDGSIMDWGQRGLPVKVGQ